MRMGLIQALTALGVTAMAFAPLPHRLVIVVGQPGDPRVAAQHARLARNAHDLRERDVAVQDFTPRAARRERPGLGINPGTDFEVLLVGRDGGVKLRRRGLLAVPEIKALIDAMPTRQEEMQKQRGT